MFFVWRGDENYVSSGICGEKVYEMWMGISSSKDPGGDSMNVGRERQLQLLLFAIGNVIDENPKVEHISYGEIWYWLNDILEMKE